MVDDHDDPILGYDDAFNIASKVVEMADRVKRVDPAVPGATARWFFDIDDDRFEVTVRKAEPQPGG